MAELTIADVLTHYGGKVDVPDYGWRSIKCCFHDDSTASASVNLDKGLFVCHTCDVKGDAIGIVMKRERLGYGAACEYAEKVFGKSSAHVPSTVSSGRERRKPKRRKWSGLPD